MPPPDPPIVNTSLGLLAMLAKARQALADWAAEQVRHAAIRQNQDDPRDIRPAQLAQAFGQEQMFPKQPLRPTSLTKFQDQPTYSMDPYLPTSVYMGKLANQPLPPLPYRLTEAENQAVMGYRPGPPDHPLASDLSALQTQLGLGNATLSLGKGDTGQPYLSVFDSWDFAPGPSGTDLGLLDKAVLSRATKPFNLYDRIPFDLEEGKIPFAIPTKHQNRDINLPTTKTKAELDELERQAHIKMLTKKPGGR